MYNYVVTSSPLAPLKCQHLTVTVKILRWFCLVMRHLCRYIESDFIKSSKTMKAQTVYTLHYYKVMVILYFRTTSDLRWRI